MARLAHSVSVVIPTYNYGRYLGRAIESVLAQTVVPTEIIVVDDGSTDETPQVLERYKSFITILRRPNGGVSAARNAGVSLASCGLVAFLDSDDVWRPTKLERQLELLSRYPECGAIGCGVEVVDRQGTVLRRVRFMDATGPARERLRAIALRRSWVGGSSSGALMPREVLADLGGFDETLWAAEDWDLWLRVCSEYPVRNVSETLTQVWDHRSGTFRDARRMATWQFRVLDKLQKDHPRTLGATEVRQIRAMIESDAAGECYGAGEWLDCLRHSAKSLGAWPFAPATWRMLIGSGIRFLRS